LGWRRPDERGPRALTWFPPPSTRNSSSPADVAALAVHLRTNTAVTGATFDIDGGQ